VNFKVDSEVDIGVVAGLVVEVVVVRMLKKEGMRLVSRRGRGRVVRKMEVSRMKRAVVRMSLVVVVVGLVSTGVEDESMTTSEGRWGEMLEVVVGYSRSMRNLCVVNRFRGSSVLKNRL